MINVEKSMTIEETFDENAEPPPPYYDENNESKGSMNPSELESSDMMLQDAMLNYKCALDVACAHVGGKKPTKYKGRCSHRPLVLFVKRPQRRIKRVP